MQSTYSSFYVFWFFVYFNLLVLTFVRVCVCVCVCVCFTKISNWVGLCRWMISRQHLNSPPRLVALPNLEMPALWLFPHGPLVVCFSCFGNKTHIVCVHTCVFSYIHINLCACVHVCMYICLWL